MANNWTYFILDPDTDLIKIGQSKNPFDRIDAFRRERPNVEIIALFPDHSIERELHALFKDRRETGEWFRPDDRLLTYMKENHHLPQFITIQGEPPLQPPPVVFTEPIPPEVGGVDPRLDFASGLLVLVIWGAVIGVFAMCIALNGQAAFTWRFALMLMALPLAAYFGPIKRYMRRAGDSP